MHEAPNRTGTIVTLPSSSVVVNMVFSVTPSIVDTFSAVTDSGAGVTTRTELGSLALVSMSVWVAEVASLISEAGFVVDSVEGSTVECMEVSMEFFVDGSVETSVWDARKNLVANPRYKLDSVDLLKDFVVNVGNVSKEELARDSVENPLVGNAVKLAEGLVEKYVVASEGLDVGHSLDVPLIDSVVVLKGTVSVARAEHGNAEIVLSSACSSAAEDLT